MNECESYIPTQCWNLGSQKKTMLELHHNCNEVNKRRTTGPLELPINGYWFINEVCTANRNLKNPYMT
jgi:hypothetical protein